MVFEIGDIAVDTDRREIRRAGERQSTEPQVFDLITYLIDCRNRVVTRDELFEHVWNGRIVSETTLSSRIKAARTALGDDGKEQSVIRTYYRRGFRFVAEVSVVEHEPSIHTVPSIEIEISQPSDRIENTGIEKSPDLSAQPSVAVLPFNSLGDENHRPIIADGLSLDITTRLARTPWLFVISRGTSFTFRGLGQDIRSVAARLGVRYVLQGSVQIAGQTMRVQTGLSDACAGREVWAEKYDGILDDVFAIQDEIATNIVATTAREIENAERARSLLIQPEDLDSWTAYHRGCWHMYKTTPEHFAHAKGFFEQALAHEPKMARVHAGLSFVHWQNGFHGMVSDRNRAIRLAVEHAQNCVDLDPQEPLGHWSLGRALQLDSRFAEAIDEVDIAINLNPNFAQAYYSLGLLHFLQGRPEASSEPLATAMRLSPLDPLGYAVVATQAANAAFEGRYDDAADLADKAAHHRNAHYHIAFIAAYCNALAGRQENASKHLARLKAERPGYTAQSYLSALPVQDDGFRELVVTTARQMGLP